MNKREAHALCSMTAQEGLPSEELGKALVRKILVVQENSLRKAKVRKVKDN